MASENDALSALIKTLTEANSTELRAAAAEGLGIAGGPEARAHLIKVLNGPASTELRAAAARALGVATHR